MSAGAWRIVPGEPIGTERVRAQFAGPRGEPRCRLVDRPVYRKSPEALALGDRRKALGLTFDAAAARVGLSTGEFVSLVLGWATLADPADWPALLARLGAPA